MLLKVCGKNNYPLKSRSSESFPLIGNVFADPNQKFIKYFVSVHF